jgi:primosomal protein N' (replication factor Y)
VGRVVRVLPAVAGLDKEFDYFVPKELASEVRVGTVVRVDLHGRRVAAWVIADGVEPPVGVRLRPVARVTGWGPEPALLELAGWAAWRWAGRRDAMVATASPPGAVRALPPPALAPPASPTGAGEWEGLVERAVAAGAATIRVPPAADPTPIVALLAQRGSLLVIVPSATRAAGLAQRLRRAGAGVAVVPGEWAQARAGAAVVVGARAAAWAPCPGLAAVAVIDGHDEGLAQEQAPTWHATAVARERARRAGVPCVVTSGCPTLELVAAAPVLVPSRSTERSGWAALDVIDRRGDDPRLGLYSERLVKVVREAGRVVCVLNRTGRARLLACGACGELARCERCGAAVAEAVEAGAGAAAALVCPRCSTARPRVCAACGSTALKRLRVGVSRAREELETLAGRPVAEVTASTSELPGADVLVGTEAVLHRVRRADVVAFLDFDQELVAPRFRAGEQALSLLARAARVVGGRRSGGRVLVQTRLPEHPAIAAALFADPDRLAHAEMAMRQALRLPPTTAMAVVSGPGADAYAAGLTGLLGIELLGPDDGRWLVRAPDHQVLADALASVARPPERLRVEVDPLRV